MPIKKRVKKDNEGEKSGIPLYTPLKYSLEKSGMDSATAGQTSWLFVSLLIAVVMSGLYILVTSVFDLKLPESLSHNPFFENGFLLIVVILHFCIVMLRLKYLLVNTLFVIASYIVLSVLHLRDIYVLLSLGFVFFIIYLLTPIYSWRIKMLDGILYFVYAITALLLTYT
ncbi:MAG: hypothetical protein MR025_03115 [Helicobacter trogontum]|uniref:Uncharacterized protein n=1 Tax=Helicobacter trogontum TaxID=50960 RepID=A0ABQ0D2D7_9HELI|nr:hypothetical protein [Helicobacter trogontum]MCI5786426.1 hypothetical protein [Helicobacter trogontum]